MNSSLKTQLVIPEDDPRFVSMRQLGSYRSDRYSSKLWILPDGTIKTIDDWHYRWILSNGSFVARYGLDIEQLPDEEDPVRIAAIKAGLFRGNYLLKSGSLVIEGLLSRFTREIQEAVQVLITSNSMELGVVTLTLFNDLVSATLAYKQIRWAQYSESDKQKALAELIDLGFVKFKTIVCSSPPGVHR